MVLLNIKSLHKENSQNFALAQLSAPVIEKMENNYNIMLDECPWWPLQELLF